MSVLRALFGPSREEMWRRLCREIGADYIDRGVFKSDVVQASVGDWIITLDTYTQSTGKSSVTYTRIRAPYVNPDKLQFRIYRSGFFSELGKWFGMQDIEVGDRRFDGAFVIQGNSEFAVAQLFANERIQALLQTQPKVHLEVKGDEGWFGPSFPDGVDELYFQVVGVIKDVDRLRRLFDLFSEVLHHLCHVGSAYEDDVDLVIEKLLGPGGTIAKEVVLWEGDPPRHQAAEHLARLKNPRAVEPLISVLDDRDPELAAKAIRALGEIADGRAVGPVLPFLGVGQVVEGNTFAELAAHTLRQLGEEVRVQAFGQALEGNIEPLKTTAGEYRPQVSQALINALGDGDGSVIAHAAEALANLGAAEALPSLRAVVRRASKNDPTRLACEEAISELEARAALPRPAKAAEPDVDTLPRSVHEPAPSTDTLPKASPPDGAEEG